MLRSTTNLVIPENLQLPKKELKQNFLYVYGKGYSGPEPLFMQKLWLSVFLPEIANSPGYGKNKKALRDYYTEFAKEFRAGYLKLKKVNDPQDPHFVAAIPLAEFSRYNISAFASQLNYWFAGGKMSESLPSAAEIADTLKQGAEAKELQQKVIPGAQVVQKMHLDGKAAVELEKTLLGVRLQYQGQLAVVFADFKITKAEAQQLTTTEWMMIRNMDLYPLLLQWVAGAWGYRSEAPLTSFPVSKVAKTLPPVEEGQARVNADNLGISHDGSPMWLYKQLDNTSRYEDLYSQVGDQGDDTFGLLDVSAVANATLEGLDVKVHLPANIPVLIDWVNNRFAYTQSNGILKVQDLSRFKAADSSHINNLIRNWSLSDDTLKHIVNVAHTAGVQDKLFYTQEELQAIMEESPATANKIAAQDLTVMKYWATAVEHFKVYVNEAIFLKDISTLGEPIFRPLARWFDMVHGAVLSNMDAVNTKYSVSGISSTMGIITLISKYANDRVNIELAANKICAAAANQKVDPNWEPPSIPLIMDNPERPFGLLPHQKKVRNLLKDSPDFAILPVQAGGGKTPLAITDVLYEIKENRSKPYLILCPSTLVAQYVKEITYFTSGKLNVIPITSDVILRNGFERLTQMTSTAPRNTVVVVDYDVLRRKAYDVCYGTTAVKIYPVIEFLRQFNFGYALMDEAHYLKNDSQRTRAAMVLIADIPKKRLASGTMAHDSPSDLAMQIAMLDPTVFGSRDEFNQRFGLPGRIKGGRVLEWQPGAQQQIMRMIKSRIVVAKAMRKEWAALLPQAEEKFHGVELSAAQMTVYNSILNEALDKMREDAKTNPDLAKFFKSQTPMLENPQPGGDEGQDEVADEEAEDAADEEAGAPLEALLKFYLARLEQFLTAPGSDELGARVLQGDDLISPKVREIINIVRSHVEQNIEGKCLIFTNYIASAEAIYEAMPDDLKAQGILYTAADKTEAGAAFEKNPNKKWMVGVEYSMNTGLNFQHVSRLIRVETVWNPGTLEQGNSRVNRPEMKKADRREKIFYDWVVANNTFDVTKIRRLIAKVIAVAKFENAENPAYEAIPELSVIPMNVEAIQTMNNWSALIQNATAYKEFKRVQAADFKEYREQHGDLVLTPLQIAPDPNDAMLMAEVPYVAGLELFKAGDNGLIRVDEYLRQDEIEGVDVEEDTAAEESEESLSPEKRKQKAMAEALKGKMVHTEFGDGVVKSVMLGERKINVLLNNGYLMRVRMAAAFVITKEATEEESMREQTLKSISTTMPVMQPVEAQSPLRRADSRALRQAEEQRIAKEKEKNRKKAEKQTAVSVELAFNVSNGFLGITYFAEGDDKAKAALQALGFRPTEAFVMAEVKTARHLEKQFNAWSDAGFTLDKTSIQMGVSQAFRDLRDILVKGTLSRGATNFKFATKNDLANFFRMEHKPSTSKNEIKPYPMIEDGVAYIVMPVRGQPATQKAIQVKSMGIRWQQSADTLVYYGLDLAATGKKIKEIMAAGIQIANIEDLKKEFKLLKKVKIRPGEN